ncbi:MULTISPECIES: hypothetical protein [Flavobacterium]|uniref:Uncharacterized protein n=1 Tax=Flavobacterium orientale TaxID=1756020 RepID=A0A916Y165_9FLAO|nr:MULTISPECIES: hypothetical protein [Flavobacterium]GGD25185.1 hypothetical protein GCM10011343_14150 [Flavobacterium orientale]
MNLHTKAFFYQLLAFIVFFIPFRILIGYITGMETIWVSIGAFMLTLLLAPKFQAIKTNEGVKLYMKWLFIKGVKELK